MLLPHLLAHQVAELSRIDSWRALRDLALDSGVIVLAAWFAETVINPLTYVLAVILIGVRFHALAVLMHDATHYRLFSSRGWNELPPGSYWAAAGGRGGGAENGRSVNWAFIPPMLRLGHGLCARLATSR
jgi:hypothetical protein